MRTECTERISRDNQHERYQSEEGVSSGHIPDGKVHDRKRSSEEKELEERSGRLQMSITGRTNRRGADYLEVQE